jgi:hypothetical protein
MTGTRAAAARSATLWEKRPCHDAVDPALEVLGDVARRLALPEADVAGGEVDRGAAELDHPDLEGDPRAQARLLEDHGEGPAEEERSRPAGPQLRLQPAGEREDGLDLGRRQVGDAEQVALLAVMRGAPSRGCRTPGPPPRCDDERREGEGCGRPCS